MVQIVFFFHGMGFLMTTPELSSRTSRCIAFRGTDRRNVLLRYRPKRGSLKLLFNQHSIQGQDAWATAPCGPSSVSPKRPLLTSLYARDTHASTNPPACPTITSFPMKPKMGKETRGFNPHRPIAGRVEKRPQETDQAKHRREQREKARNLPPWYFRVLNIEYTKNRDARPADFDQDLSELEDVEPVEREVRGCVCPPLASDDSEEWECECGYDPDEDSDSFSEKSYEGSDADCYYEMKEQREERKHDVRARRQRSDKARRAHTACEKEREDEVEAAYESFKMAGKESQRATQIDIVQKQFGLYSSGHTDRFYAERDANNPESCPRRTITFYHIREKANDSNGNGVSQKLKEENSLEDRPIYGDADFGTGRCTFGPFRLPTRASRKAVEIKDSNGTCYLSMKFFGDDYIKMRVSAGVVFKRSTTSPTPECFDFSGIWDGSESAIKEREKVKQERKKLQEERTKNAPPSPRETWFNLNHPMGELYHGGW